jgi:hypothetical protein
LFNVYCGELPEGASDGVANFLKDGGMYPDWPIDLVERRADVSWWIDAVESVKALGNEYFKVHFAFLLQLMLLLKGLCETPTVTNWHNVWHFVIANYS